MILIGPVTLFFILLLMFKPIRRVLLWTFIVAAAFVVACWNGWIGPPAHAQMSSVVQCRIGSYAEQMPDFVCAALQQGASKLHGRGRAADTAACVAEVYRHVRPTGPDAVPAMTHACHEIDMAIAVEGIRLAITPGALPAK